MKQTQFPTAQTVAAAIGAALAVFCLALLSATPALASDGHAFSTSFNGGTEAEPGLAAPQGVAINQSTGNVYVVDSPASEVQTLTVNATGGTFKLTFEGQTTAALPFNATSSEVTVALRNLSKIGSGNVKATGGPGATAPYTIAFSGALAEKRLPQIAASAASLTPAGSTATTAIATVGGPGNDVAEFSEAGALIRTFGSKGTGDGQFENPTEIAVANAGPNQGDVYVLDGGGTSKGANRVEVFSETGAYLSQVKKEEFQAASSKDFNYEGPNYLEGLGLDSGGNLWVFSGDNLLFELPVGGSLEGVTKFQSVPGPGFLVTPGPEFRWTNGSGATRFGPGGENLGGFGFSESPSGTGLAVDLKSGHEGFYLDRGTVVAHFPVPASNAKGGPYDTFGSGTLEGGAGIAVNEANGKVYVADSKRNRVDVFAATILPTAALEAATGIAQTSAILHGTVNPEGLSVSACQFEYWRSGHEAEKQTASCSPTPGSGSSPVAVSAALSGLAPKTEYVFRLIATNANGTSTANEEKLKFKTLAPLLPLTVTKAGAGEGTVESLAPHTGINCGLFCSAEFEEGSEVELKATPAIGSEFTGWSGAGCSGTGACKVKMSAAEEVTATFVKEGEAKYPLTIDIEGSGSGSVECDTGSGAKPCEAEYTQGTHVELIAKAAAGSGFLEWTHNCTGTGACKVTMDEAHQVGAVFSLQAGPQVKNMKATEVGKTVATLHAEVNPEGLATTYRFQYIAESQYEEDGEAFGAGTQETTAGSIPAGFAYQAAAKSVSGLTPGTDYRFRAIAENPKGEAEGESASFETLPYASIDALYVTEVSATAATLQAEVNPLGEDAHARFEYLSQVEYEENGESFSGPNQPTTLPVPAADLGAGSKDVSLSQVITGLAPGKSYVYRLLLTNALSESLLPGGYSSSTNSFATQIVGPLALPDKRGWELVSPPNKQGALIYPLGGSLLSEGGAIQAAADGSAITYVANAPTEPLPAGYANGVQVLSKRFSSGWDSRDIATPHAEATRVSSSQGEEYRLFSPDLARGLIQPIGPFTPQLSPEATEQTPYLRTDFASSGAVCAHSCYRPLVTAAEGFADVPQGTEFGQPCPRISEAGEFFCGPRIESASTDLRHVAILAESGPGVVQQPLVAGAPIGALYEWSAEAAAPNALELASVLPGGKAVAGTLASPGSYGYRNAISADGSMVFWTGNGHLYARDGESKETAQLDRVVSGGGEGSARPVFQAAGTDGTRAFFTDGQHLTSASGGDTHSPDLYEWRAEGIEGCGEGEGCLTDVTPLNGAEVADVKSTAIGASENGEYVYFTANGVLSEEPNPRGETATPGDCSEALNAAPLPDQTCNLYLRHDGATSFIATLSGADKTDWGKDGGLTQLTARVSPNGRWLAFASQRSLTGYDNRDAKTGEPDQEAFLFHAAGGGEGSTLVCASCNPTGARPLGATAHEAAVVNNDHQYVPSTRLSAALPGWNAISEAGVSSALYQSRYLSDSGRLFFDSSDALVPHDTNGTWDAYEYEPAKGGEEEPPNDTCAESSPTYSPASEGCIDLVSSGTSAKESAFLDASENGDDVFFLTAGQLTPRDEDTGYDVYDARAGGGEAEEAKPVECLGDACQQPVRPPEDATPGSLSYSGPEEGPNHAEGPSTGRCAKGRVRRKGRCVSRHHHKSKRHRQAGRKRGGRK